MSTFRAIIEIENKVNRILSDKANEIAELEEKIKADQKAKDTALLAMEQATTEGNIKAYQEAKARRRDAEDAKEMHETRLDFLKNKPLISRRDYEKAVSDIFLEVAAVDNQTKQALAALSEQMRTQAIELQEYINHANEVLNHLQHDVFRDADMTKHPKTGQPYISSEEKTVNNFETVHWGMVGVSTLAYKDYLRGNK